MSLVKDVSRLFLTNPDSFHNKIRKPQSSHYGNVSTNPLGNVRWSLGSTL